LASNQRTLSIFDILGPIMIGPSSNHTGGANRIGQIARMILGEEPTDVSFYFYGSMAETYKGHIEVPCIKRNVIGVANAFAVADMALVGIQSVIPPDEVIDALRNIQTLMPMELKDTMLGGLGITKTAKRLKKEWLEKIK